MGSNAITAAWSQCFAWNVDCLAPSTYTKITRSQTKAQRSKVHIYSFIQSLHVPKHHAQHLTRYLFSTLFGINTDPPGHQRNERRSNTGSILCDTDPNALLALLADTLNLAQGFANVIFKLGVKFYQRAVNTDIDNIVLRDIYVSPWRIDARLLLRGCGARCIEPAGVENDAANCDSGEARCTTADGSSNGADSLCVLGAHGSDAVVLVECLSNHSVAGACIPGADAQEAGVDAPLVPYG